MNITEQRWCKMTHKDERELTVFGDASEYVFCAVAYVESAGFDYRHVSFAMGEAGVATIKHHVTPKLELMAAVTATRLKELLVKEHECNFRENFKWTDSTIVLKWIRNNDKKQPVFVVIRAAETLDSTTVDKWNHIGGVQNPADLATRGISYPEDMESDCLQGPLWLKDEDWISHIGQKLTNDHEQRDDVFEVSPNSEAQTFLEPLASKPSEWERFSHFNRVKFGVIRILNMLPKCRYLTLVDLIKITEFKICSLVQHECFSSEIYSWKKTMIVHSKSKLIGVFSISRQ